MDAQQVLLFGDQADAPVPMIRRLVGRAHTSTNLQSFLQGSIDSVQLEVSKLLPEERESIGWFRDVQDLVASFSKGLDRFGIVQMVLVFIARIGELILHAEIDPSIVTEDGTSRQILSLGICGGLLPAAAAAVSTNVAELIQAASFFVGLNCRVAVAISRRSVEIENDKGSWAFSALGSVVTQLPSILDQFHEEESIPQHRQAYIAVSTPTWATVFGPPSVLRRLLETSKALKDSEITVLPAFGAVHAGHLAAPDFDQIIGESPILDKRIKENYKLISGSNYEPFECSTLRDLLPEILLDIFQNSTDPSQLFEACGSHLDKGREVSLFMLGATSYLVLLRRSLHGQGFHVKLHTNSLSLPNSERLSKSRYVAIVGMSGTFPGSIDIDKLWESLMTRQEFHQKIPADRFDVGAFWDATGASKYAITSPYGCFLEQPGHFDHKMFNVSPREAVHMDPGQRLLMHVVYEALEDAGLTTNGTVATHAKHIGTFIGDGSDDWRERQQASGVDVYMIQGTQRAFTPGRINHHFKWEGPTFCVDSACGSTASAVGLAYKALVDRDCDTAIAGGSNIIATPFWQSALGKGGFLSQTGGCKTFREDADGYCRGEAIGAMVLKRLDDAVQDNDKICAVISGYARNHSAETVSITRPHTKTQERLFENVLKKSGFEAHDIDYVEMHGTGTTAGDSTELESVANVFAQKSERTSPLVVGAIKANIGHSEAASGICSIMKAALMFQKGVIPPQVGIPERLGTFACLDQAAIHIPGEPVQFSRQIIGKNRKVIVNNFDAAGGNSCFALEEPPIPAVRGIDPRSYHVVACSAHCVQSLEQNKRNLLDYLKRLQDDINLSDLAYTTTARRMPHSMRSAYVGDSIKCIADSLEKDLAQGSPVHATREDKSPIVFLFTGQGSHYAGMGRDLFKTSPAFRTAILKLHRICETHGFPSFLELITDPRTEIKNTSTVQIHLGLVSVEIALVDLWKAWGIEPDVVIGHSIGEYAALYTAGVLSANDVMYLVGKRAELIECKCVAGTHGMLSIAAAPTQVDTILSDSEQDNLQISCFNCPNMAVLSGERPQLLQVKERLEEQRVKCKLLDIQYAMHSTQLDGITEEFRRIVQGVRFSAPRVKIVSTLLGDLVTEDNDHVFNGDYLVRHSRERVQFQRAIEACKSRHLVDPSAFWLEIGPSPICLGLVRSNIGSIPFDHAFASLDKGANSWKCVSAALAAMYKANKPIQWREFHRDFVDCLSLISLPKYAWDTKNFWIPYQGTIPLPNSQQVTATESQLLSTCLHHIERHEDTAEGQSATFTSKISHPSLMDIIRGHKLSGITVCPAGVFSDMALTAARYMLTGEVSDGPFPNLSVVNTQIDRPIVPQPNSRQVVEVNVTRSRISPDSFSVWFTDQAQPSATISKCIVQVRDEVAFHLDRQNLLPSIQSKIAKLKMNAEAGRANRFLREIFYKLFGDLMSYNDMFEGVEEAIVSQNFDEAVAAVKIPAHDATNPDERFTLSPYWIDALTHLAGFLFNGNPKRSEDYVYMGTHMERLEIAARDLSPNVRYQSYAYIERPRDSDMFQGHVYILDGDLIVGYLEGARFRRMPRNTLHRVLGKIEPSTGNQSFLGRHSVDSNGIAKVTNGPVETPKEASKPANGQSTSYYATFLKILLQETGMVESELQPSTFFAEIGVDSLMSISVLAAFKAETGLELAATWLMEHPTLQDAQREFRSIQSRTTSTSLPNGTISTSTNSHQDEHPETDLDGYAATNGVATNGRDTTKGYHETDCDTVFSHGTRIINGAVSNGHHIKIGESRSCNIVLMQGSATASPCLPLFLIADGAGSAAAYLHLPKLGHDHPVWAVESPWVHDPENFDCSFQEAVAFYLTAVRAKQPHGPYLLGGWSAGGVFAYEVARLLLEAGDQVKALVIVDIPGPRVYDHTKVVEPTMDIIDELGMLTGIERSYGDSTPKSQRLKRHMLSTVTCLSKLDPIAMRPECQPDHVFVICATKDILARTPHGGCGGDVGNSAVSKLDAWFYPSSYGVGPRGWDALVGDGNLEYFAVEGDHFSIMLPPEVSQLGPIIQNALGTCGA